MFPYLSNPPYFPLFASKFENMLCFNLLFYLALNSNIINCNS